MKRWLVIFMLVLNTGVVPVASTMEYRRDHRRDYQVMPEPQRPGDTVIIHKGKKCELVCTKLWDGTVECREYRC